MTDSTQDSTQDGKQDPKQDSRQASKQASIQPSSEAVASAMPVLTHADLWPVLVQGLGDPLKPREKSAPDGRPTFSTGGILKLVRRGETVSDKSASVHVINPPPGGRLQDETKYRAVGTVWVQPYENNSRMALSITVEALEEV